MDDDSGFIQRDANKSYQERVRLLKRRITTQKTVNLRKLDQKWQSRMKPVKNWQANF